MTVVVRWMLIGATGLSPRGAPRWRKSSRLTATAPLTPCVLANTRGAMRYVCIGRRDAAPMNAGDMPGLTPMRPPERNARLTITVVRSRSRVRGAGTK